MLPGERSVRLRKGHVSDGSDDGCSRCAFFSICTSVTPDDCQVQLSAHQVEKSPHFPTDRAGSAPGTEEAVQRTGVSVQSALLQRNA